MSRDIYDRLRVEIDSMPAVNHHEHAHLSFMNRPEALYDLPRYLCAGYLRNNLMATGCTITPQDFGYVAGPDPEQGAEEIWSVLRPHLDLMRTTTNFRYILPGLSDLMDVTEAQIFSEDWREANRRVLAYSRANLGKGGEFSNRMNVTATVLDSAAHCPDKPDIDPGAHNVLIVFRMDRFIEDGRGLADTLEEHPGKSWDEWLGLFDAVFRQGVAAGAAGFKCGLAYNRSLDFKAPDEKAARAVYEKGALSFPWQERAPYEDFMVDRLCTLCEEANLPLQFHTGLQSVTGPRTNQANVLCNTRANLMTGLLRRHWDLRVDLFHGSYPWFAEAGLLARHFKNVYIDGCWMSHIAPMAYRQAIISWIETCTINKIFAWGGDHMFLEQTYASLVTAKNMIARALADMVETDYFDEDTALFAARRILHDNGAEFFGLKPKTV